MARHDKLDAAKAEAKELFDEEEDGAALAVLKGVLKDLESDVVRGGILKTGQRIDGRTTSDVRPIVSEVGVLPRTHGSALFTRGETQALVTATLGTGQDEQIIDALEGEYREKIHAALQLPALFGGRGQAHDPAGAPRDRPRQAGLAGGSAASAVER